MGDLHYLVMTTLEQLQVLDLSTMHHIRTWVDVYDPYVSGVIMTRHPVKKVEVCSFGKRSLAGLLKWSSFPGLSSGLDGICHP